MWHCRFSRGFVHDVASGKMIVYDYIALLPCATLCYLGYIVNTAVGFYNGFMVRIQCRDVSLFVFLECSADDVFIRPRFVIDCRYSLLPEFAPYDSYSVCFCNVCVQVRMRRQGQGQYGGGADINSMVAAQLHHYQTQQRVQQHPDNNYPGRDPGKAAEEQQYSAPKVRQSQWDRGGPNAPNQIPAYAYNEGMNYYHWLFCVFFFVGIACFVRAQI